jgi:hypothetical protein
MYSLKREDGSGDSGDRGDRGFFLDKNAANPENGPGRSSVNKK